jgi:type II secretory ATPase GspE/PulE/Tfp pilus assembly ATPase PilB-like protein
MTGNMVVARLKALAGMDIVERNKQQTGAFAITCHSVNYRLSLSTVIADYGESLIMTPVA